MGSLDRCRGTIVCMAKSLLLVMGICLSMGLRPAPVFACSCEPLPTMPKAFQEADVVFLGSVTEKRSHAGQWHFSWTYPFVQWQGGFPQDIYLRVERVWKGSIGATTHTTLGPILGCDYSFEVGHRYLVYGQQGAQTWYTYFCDRTAEDSIERAQEDLQLLGPGIVPRAMPSDEVSNSRLFLLSVLFMLVLGVLLFLVGYKQRQSTASKSK